MQSELDVQFEEEVEFLLGGNVTYMTSCEANESFNSK